jgi:hypothetical protein
MQRVSKSGAARNCAHKLAFVPLKAIFIDCHRIWFLKVWVATYCSRCRESSQQLLKLYYYSRSRDSSVGIATGYGLDDQGEREFESR